MNKNEFIEQLRLKLSELPKREVQDRLDFYIEMIDDRMEEGISEEEAVRDIGSVDEIAKQIAADISVKKIDKEKFKRRKRIKAREIILLSLGSPIWLSLIISVLSVILGLYVSVWSVVISAWAIFVSFAAIALGCLMGGIAITIFSNPLTGIALIGVALISAGLSVFLFFGSKALTKGILQLTKKAPWGVKKYLIGKEKVQ